MRMASNVRGFWCPAPLKSRERDRGETDRERERREREREGEYVHQEGTSADKVDKILTGFIFVF